MNKTDIGTRVDNAPQGEDQAMNGDLTPNADQPDAGTTTREAGADEPTGTERI